MANEVPETKPRRKALLVILLSLVGVFTIAYFAGFQRNPSVLYHPTDGMAMVRDLDHQLAEREGFKFYFRGMRLDAMPTPANYSGAGYSPTDDAFGRAIMVVRYNKVFFGRDFRKLARRFRVSLPMPEQHVQRVDFEQLLEVPPRVRTWRRAETPSLTPEQETELAKASALIGSALELENNGELNLHSDFVVVQNGLQVRVYPMDSLPAAVRELLDACSKQLSDRGAFLAND